MPYYSDNLDDLLAFDGIRSFTGGQASGLQSDQLASNQVQEMYNMTLSVKGSLETRLGASAFNSTATTQLGSVGGFRYFDTAQYEDVVNVAQGRLYTINSNGSATLHPPDQLWNDITGTWDAYADEWANGYSAPFDVFVSMAQFNDKMYMADSDGDLHYWDGQIATRQGGKVRAITVNTGGSNYTSATAIVTGRGTSHACDHRGRWGCHRGYRDGWRIWIPVRTDRHDHRERFGSHGNRHRKCAPAGSSPPHQHRQPPVCRGVGGEPKHAVCLRHPRRIHLGFRQLDCGQCR
jgi:hypothetical protein